jgi:hypothetical protein
MEIKWHNLKDLAAKKFYGNPNNHGICFIRLSRNGKTVSMHARPTDESLLIRLGA